MSVTIRKRLQAINEWLMALLGSSKFFYGIVALLVLQAGWIALTARYPQAFDENYHLGLIKLHVEYGLLPFFSYQPEGASVYGAVISDPSYLFHYLMSLPYWLLSGLTSNETVQIIALRLINIGLFVWGLFVYRRLLAELKISRPLQNIVMLVFVLLPVVPLLAAHINYDNLMVPITGLLFLYVVRYINYLRSRPVMAPLIPVRMLLLILLFGAIGSVIKFAFAPILLATIVAVTAATIFYYVMSRIKPRGLRQLFDTSGRRWILVLIAFATLLAVGLSFERYGMNLVQYGSPVPKCHKVLSIDECMDYSPWARDYKYSQIYPRPTAQGYAVYPFVWVWRMVYETMFTITSRTYPPSDKVYYYGFSPLIVAHVVAWIGVAGGVLGIIVFWRRIRRNRPLTVLLGITVFYAIILFIQNFSMYHHSGEAVAIHGRYLVPVYPVLLVCLAIGWRGLLERFGGLRYSAVVFLVLIILFMQGGGITNWLIRSNAEWYWPGNQAALQVNNTLKSVVDRVVIH